MPPPGGQTRSTTEEVVSWAGHRSVSLLAMYVLMTCVSYYTANVSFLWHMARIEISMEISCVEISCGHLSGLVVGNVCMC